MKTFATNTAGGIVLLMMLALGTRGSMLLNGLALGACIGGMLLIYFGPDRLGIGLMMLGTFLSPINGLKLGTSGNVTFADFAYVLGMVLLMPRLMKSSSRMPRLYTWGVLLLTANALVVSAIIPDPVSSLAGYLRVAWAVIIIPVVLHRMNMSRKLLDAFVWTYVFGQVCSTVKGMTYAGVLGGGRSAGYTTHPDFFALAGQLAFAMCVYLFYRTPRNHRWFVVAVAGICALSVIQSGSRASLLCLALTIIVWPLVERTAISVYVLVSFLAVAAVGANYLIQNAPPGSAFDRLKGGGTAQASSQARATLLSNGIAKFLDHPIRGSGWVVTDVLTYHNVYLEVGIAGGVIAVLAFVLIIASTIKPLFAEPVPNRLAFMGLSYAVFAAIGPTIYDRILWGGLGLVFALHNSPDDEIEDGEIRTRRTAEKAPERPPQPIIARPIRPRAEIGARRLSDSGSPTDHD